MVSQGGVGATSVEVALRIKPLTHEDLEKMPSRFQRHVITTSYTPGQVIVETDKRQVFQYDYAFGPDASQEEVYEKSVTNLLGKFLEGYNVTILAYGQTSSGKTYTMGTADNGFIPLESKGMIPRTMSALFEKIESERCKTSKFTVKVSFIEIHNEDLIDLLGEGEEDERPPVNIREDSKGNIYWTGLQEVKVKNVDEVIKHLLHGSENRQVGVTDMNAKSSRSHAIFSVTMVHKKFVPYEPLGGPPATPPPDSSQNMDIRDSPAKTSPSFEGFDEGEWETITSKFHFVDLAGSERLKRTAASGDRAKEGISINSGLLALGNVISALGDPSKAKQMTHVPYRDSKLTRLLQDSLGGNAQTLMIACVSPAEYNLNETINTLKYANRARNIKNMASVNKEESGWNDVSHLQGLVIKLRAEVSSLKSLVANGQQHQHTGGYISPGRVTPTTPTTQTTSSGMKLPARSNSISVIPGRSTPTSGIPGRSTPTSGIPGRSTPTSAIPGRSTPTTGMPGRSMYNNIVNGREPTNRMRPGSPLTTFTHGSNVQVHKDKEVEILEEQLIQLQRSYAELSQKYAKTSAELAMHQNNYDELENTKSEPQIENYETMISSLESNLAITNAALLHSETLLREQEIQMKELERENELNKNTIDDFQSRTKDLESKLQDQEVGARMRIQSDSYPEKFISETVQLLEKRLEEKDAYCAELEAKLERFTKDESTKQLREELDDRDFRITQLESKMNLLVEEVDKLRNMEGFQYQAETGPLDSTSGSSSSSGTFSNYDEGNEAYTK